MTMSVLVTGGTGRLGRLVARRLKETRCGDVRVLTRHHREAASSIGYVTGDLATGEGLDAAVNGATVIVHCASSTKGDIQAARNLVQAASGKAAPHLVYISIVGIDSISSWNYPKAKLQTERVVAESGLPWTILRAAQFYDYLLGGIRRLTRLPVVPVPAGFRVQPVDEDEVAARLVELALGEPACRVPDIAGPEVTSWVDLVRDYLWAAHRRRLVVPVPLPGTRTVRAGGLLPGPGHTAGQRTWEEFLADRLGSRIRPGRLGEPTAYP